VSNYRIGKYLPVWLGFAIYELRFGEGYYKGVSDYKFKKDILGSGSEFTGRRNISGSIENG
jgi:hypothetical protein